MAIVDVESKISHIYEVKATLVETKKNVERVLLEQNSLIKIIEEAEDKYDLSDDMIEKLIADKQMYEENYKELIDAMACADTLITAYEKETKNNAKHSSMTTEAIFTLACNAFGLFRERSATADTTVAAEEAVTEE